MPINYCRWCPATAHVLDPTTTHPIRTVREASLRLVHPSAHALSQGRRDAFCDRVVRPDCAHCMGREGLVRDAPGGLDPQDVASGRLALRLLPVPGVFFPLGSQLRIPAGTALISLNDAGELIAHPIVPETRMDMWPQWLREALEATVAALNANAAVVAESTALARAELEGVPVETQQRLADLLNVELRASMRAISAAAFAVDAFYASVQARSPEHPSRASWRKLRHDGSRTSRHAIVFETLRYHLKIRNNAASLLRPWIKELFDYRGWAVHASANFREVILRDDIDRGVDWHLAAFRAQNAVVTLARVMAIIDSMVTIFDRGSDEVREWQPHARAQLDELIALYDAEEGLPRVAWHLRSRPNEVKAVEAESDADETRDS